ncbi:MAG: CotH kinase family protein [Candidatus Kapaibacterium sp.]|jgi:hypothetical protein
MLKQIFHVLLFLLISNLDSYSQVFINEFSASNGNVINDENQFTPDWIELYNASDTDINLKGWRIGKKSKFSSGWELPDTVLKSKEYMILFCDKQNYVASIYQITASGEKIPSYKEDKFRFLYLEHLGDFEVELKVTAMSNYNFDSRIGIMLREDLSKDASSTSFFATSPSCERYVHVWKFNSEKIVQGHYYAENFRFPFSHIIIKLKDDTLSYFKCEGERREKIANKIHLPFHNKKYLLGLAATSCNNNILTNFVIDRLRINGEDIDVTKLKAEEFGTNLKGSTRKANVLHTDFKLSKDKGKIYLFNKSGEQIDYIEYGEQKTDISFGRYPDGSSNLVYFEKPTPGLTNSGVKRPKALEPIFSIQGGFYKNDFSLTLTNPNTSENINIYYTTNGDEPTLNSNLYLSPISISTTTVLRAKAISNNKDTNDSRIVTHTYFFGENSKLPIISLVTDSLFLWEKKQGIFTPEKIFYKKIIPANFEYFANDIPPYNSAIGLRLQGSNSRTYPQKSWRLYAEDYYQYPTFEHKFFPDEYQNNYEKLILRIGGRDWKRALMRDQIAHNLAKNLNKELICSPVNNVLTFLNGKFHGIAQFMERQDDNFIAEKYNIEKSSITALEKNFYFTLDELKYAPNYDCGKEWFDLIDTLEFLDMQRDGLEYLDSKIDLDNFTDYIILQTFLQNGDWPHNNVLFWKSTELDNKWRWIVYDLDASFSQGNIDETYSNYFDLSRLKPKETIQQLFQTIIKDSTFYRKFITRFADLMNTEFSSDNIVSKIDSLEKVLAPEIKRQQATYDSSCVNWEKEVERMREFATNRPAYQRLHLREIHYLPNVCKVILKSNIPDACTFDINTLTIDTSSWSGYYFPTIPITVTVKPKDGYEFVKWSEDHGNEKTITFDLPIDGNNETTLTIEALFDNNDSIDTNSRFTISPNPTRDKFNLELNLSTPKILELKCIDMTGKTIFTDNLHCSGGQNTFNFNLMNFKLAPGAYFVNLSYKGKYVYSTKIMFEK